MKTKLILILALLVGAVSLEAQASTPTPSTAPAISKSYVIGSPAGLTFVSATGTAPFTFQWRKNGVAISGATTSTLTFAAISVADVGTYDLVVTNSAGATLSNAGSFTVTLIAPGNVIISFTAGS